MVNGEEYRHLDDKIDRMSVQIGKIGSDVDKILGGIMLAKWMSGVALVVATTALGLVVGK